MKRQLPQNLKRLLQDIGEGAVLLQLSIRLLNHPQWRVFQNYTEAGCDLVLVRSSHNTLGRQIKIEVKTRQNIVTDRRNKNAVHFTLSEAERDASDFLVAYWLDQNDFFVVPRDELMATWNGTKRVYKFIAYLSPRTQKYNEHTAKFCNNWDAIIEATKAE
ncbi:MAG: hypothetical protein C5B50_17585 [Verrucomicrobia bacterium]|nr:MAG: hypothetical protein C5B50_17585 [Verrucomicrobiota bacterium]